MNKGFLISAKNRDILLRKNATSVHARIDENLPRSLAKHFARKNSLAFSQYRTQTADRLSAVLTV